MAQGRLSDDKVCTVYVHGSWQSARNACINGDTAPPRTAETALRSMFELVR
jgi:hypothetical protein